MTVALFGASRVGRMFSDLRAAAALGLVIGGIALAPPPAWSQAGENEPKVRSHTVMEHEMDRLRADLIVRREEMNRIRGLDGRERQSALKEHLERSRSDMKRALAMEEQMQQDLARGRMVSDLDLRRRLRLLGELVRMLIDMNAMLIEEVQQSDSRKP